MSLSTKNPSINRQEKTEELIKHHDWKFKLIQEDNPLFIPKCAYIPKGKTEHFIGVFPSEVKRGRDIYTEFTSIDLEPEDQNRTLYKWRFNPHYDEEYEKTETNGSPTNFRYLIPVSELIKIEIEDDDDEPQVINQFPDFDEIMDPDADSPLNQITLRDLAAILLKKPVSHKKWLNELIKS
jgi:hypothetical protein